MTRHLSEEELLDLAEAADSGAPDSRAARHLEVCQDCAGAVRSARSALFLARSDAIPEPSPLYWDHFSARVRDAVAAAPAPVPARIWGGSWRFALPVAAIVVLAVTASLRVGIRTEVPSSQPAHGRASDVAVAGDPSQMDADAALDPNDPSLALLSDLAGDFEWDQAADAGLVAGSGAIDRALSELNPDERVELQRILNEELARWKTPGA